MQMRERDTFKFMPKLMTLALLSLPLLACGRTDSASDPELASASSFVAGFYDWYLPSVERGAGWHVVIQDSSHLFASALVEDLRADAEAQANRPDAIVGLNGDPFLDAQDFCEVYVVGNVQHQGRSLIVDVHGDCSIGPDSIPDVVAELNRSGSDWIFVNFLYPRYDSDLVQVLNQLRNFRETEGQR